MNTEFNLFHQRKIFLLIFTTCLVSILMASCGSSDGSSTGPHKSDQADSTMSSGTDGNNAGSSSNNNNNDGDNNGGDISASDPTFANVSQIFSSSCATSGCHDSSTKQNGVDLSSYNAALGSVGNQYGKKVIQPNDAANSPLMDKISSDNPQYGVRMPRGGAPLSSDDIDLIKQWIDNGAKNN